MERRAVYEGNRLSLAAPPAQRLGGWRNGFEIWTKPEAGILDLAS
jgi:hypothetical protein